LFFFKHAGGYHGHYRSKSRAEFSTFYRQNAKPRPPEKFSTRLVEDATKHTFSKHDNRQVFLNDPTLFGSGIGKKKIDSVNKSKWNPELIAWREKLANNEAKISHESIYQHDFCNYLSNSKLLTGRKNQENRPISVYEYTFSHGEPKADLSKSVRLETYQRFINKSASAKISSHGERLSVANCLVWHNAVPKKTDSEFQRPQTVAVIHSNNDESA
jgi:hypothetical protein